MSDIIERLRNLLELATNNPNEHEAATSLAVARKIAAQHALDLEAIALDDGSKAEPQIARTSDIVLGGLRTRAYRWDLACEVARAHGCVQWARETFLVSFHAAMPIDPDDADKACMDALCERVGKGSTAELQPDGRLRITTLFSPRYSAGWIKQAIVLELLPYPKDVEVEQTLVMIGKRSLAEAAIYVYRYLVGEVDRIARERGKGRGRTVMNSLRCGLVRGLGDRLREEERLELAASSEADDEACKETGLVLVRACADAHRFLSDSFGKDPFTSTRGSARLDYEAFREGVQGADDIDIPDSNGHRRGLTGGRALTEGG